MVLMYKADIIQDYQKESFLLHQLEPWRSKWKYMEALCLDILCASSRCGSMVRCGQGCSAAGRVCCPPAPQWCYLWSIHYCDAIPGNHLLHTWSYLRGHAPIRPDIGRPSPLRHVARVLAACSHHLHHTSLLLSPRNVQQDWIKAKKENQSVDVTQA